MTSMQIYKIILLILALKVKVLLETSFENLFHKTIAGFFFCEISCFYLELTLLQKNVPLHMLAQKCGLQYQTVLSSSATSTFK